MRYSHSISTRRSSMVQTDNSECRVTFSIETDNLLSTAMPAQPPKHRLTLNFQACLLLPVLLAHLWGAYAIPLALSVVRRESSVVCRLCPP